MKTMMLGFLCVLLVFTNLRVNRTEQMVGDIHSRQSFTTNTVIIVRQEFECLDDLLDIMD